MKNTAFAGINSGDPGAAALAWSDRFKAWPFLIWSLASSMPVNYQLHEAREMLVSDVAEQTLQAASSANAISSIPYALFLGGLYFWAGLMLMKRPRPVLAILTRQWPLFLITVYIAASLLWSFNQEKVLSNTIHNLGTLFICIAAALHYRHDPWLLPKELGYVLGLSLIIQLAAVVLIPSYAIDWQGRWHGVTPHPNSLGSLAFTALWANASALLGNGRDKHRLHLIFCAFAVAAMLGANSVTSMTASVCMLFAMYALRALQKLNAGRKFYISVFGVAGCVAILIYMLGTVLDMGAMFSLFGRDANLTGRTSVWQDAFVAIAKYPVLGWSFDDHAYLIQHEGMPYPTYHNGYLDTAVSGGAMAIMLLAMLLVNWIAGFTKSSLTASQISIYSAAFGFAYLIHNLTEGSLLSPRAHLWLVFMLLACLGSCHRAFTIPGSFELGSPGPFARREPAFQQSSG